jgi:DNA-binding NtrC family response regulator
MPQAGAYRTCLRAVSLTQVLRPHAGSYSYQLIGDQGIKHASNKGVVVLLEPDASVRDALVLLLQSEGWAVKGLEGCDGLAPLLGGEGVVAVVSESSLPDCTPEEILEQCKKSGLPVIFTGHDMSLQGAVDLIRQGASDFLDKPFPQGGLVNLLNALSARQNTRDQ